MIQRDDKPAEKRSGFQFNALIVGGFKSIRDRTRLDLGPLTILAGPNSSGKSAIMQPLLLLKQTLESPYDVGPLRLDGENVSFVDSDQVFSRTGPDSYVPEVEIGIDTSEAVASLFFRRQADGISLDRWEEYDPAVGRSRSLSPQMTSSQLVREYESELRQRGELKNGMSAEATFFQKKCIPFVCFQVQQSPKTYTRFTRSPWTILEGILACLVHVPAVRATPGRTLELVRLNNSYVPVSASAFDPEASNVRLSAIHAIELEVFEGRFDRYVASLVKKWQEADGLRLGRLQTMLCDLQLSSRIEAKLIGHSRLDLLVSRIAQIENSTTSDMVSILNTGQAIPHVLPVLTALAVASPKHWVYVEQPEVHLHPGAQVRLAKYLLQAASRGAVVIVETHSNLLLKGIQQQVASGAFAPDIVKLHWFRQDDEGVTRIDSAELDEHGAFGDWPVDFNDVELDIEGRYIDAAMGRKE